MTPYELGQMCKKAGWVGDKIIEPAMRGASDLAEFTAKSNKRIRDNMWGARDAYDSNQLKPALLRALSKVGIGVGLGGLAGAGTSLLQDKEERKNSSPILTGMTLGGLGGAGVGALGLDKEFRRRGQLRQLLNKIHGMGADIGIGV